MESQTINYVQAIAGGGKSYAALPWALNKLKNDKSLNLLYVTPTTKLSEQVESDFDALDNYNVDIFRCDFLQRVNKLAVVRDDLQQLLNRDFSQKALIITHEALISCLPLCSFDKSKFILIIDEQMSVISGRAIKSDYLKKVTDHFDIIDGKPYAREEKLKSIKKSSYGNNHDEELNQAWFSGLCKAYLHDMYELKFKPFYDNEQLTSIEYISLLKPIMTQGFSEVVVLSALFKMTPMHLLWSYYFKVNFQLHHQLNNLIEQHSHMNGDRLAIHCLQDKFEWITTRFSEFTQQKACTEIIGELIAFNINTPDDILFRYKGAKEGALIYGVKPLNGRTYGQNNLENHHHIIYLPTHMPERHVQLFLKGLGITKDQIRTGWYYLEAYQAMMRSNLRSRKPTDRRVHVYLGDEGTCKFIQSLFTGCELKKSDSLLCLKDILNQQEKLPSMSGRIRKVLSDCKKKKTKEGLNIDSKVNRNIMKLALSETNRDEDLAIKLFNQRVEERYPAPT